MPLFYREHYSTAEKIIDLVVKKIRNDVSRVHPTGDKGVRLNWNLSIEKEHKSQSIKVLGDILKAALPKNLYLNYQNLTDSAKNGLREKIAEVCFAAYQRIRPSELQPPHGDFEYGDCSFEGVRDAHLTIELPNEFLNEESLKGELKLVIGFMQQALMPKEQEIFQYQNKNFL